ncbi:MAG: CesT family type III secretion system chaperone [Verrucomicrobia bacterium]|nr:CesT family type III secretion system chaperone [Verrucomicrobiota bacterium]
MIDRFTELIQQLGQYLEMDLHVDHHHACSLKIRDKVQIQLQLDAAQEKLLVASFAIEVPPGKFRENVLKEALKTNALPDPRPAIISYLDRNNRLVLHLMLPLEILNGERLASYFGTFLEQVEAWIKAIEGGQVAPVLIESTVKAPKPFGLKP